MHYWSAKLFAFVTLPSNVAFILIAIGLMLATRHGRRARSGVVLAWTGCGVLLVAGLSPLGNWLIRPLEERIPATGSAIVQDIRGIIVLGGFEDGWVSQGRGGLALNEAAERLTATIMLALQNPAANVIFTGAGGGYFGLARDAAGPVGEFLENLGISAGRIILEDRARNTYENAVYLAKLLKPARHERWALVTSAYHMPRAASVFQNAGFAIYPVPVDYRTRGREDSVRFFSRISAGLERTDLAVREWSALLVYWSRGWSKSPFPHPGDQRN